MTRAEIRRVGHDMLERVEWLDRHATVRNAKDRRELEDTVRDLEKAMLKLIDAPLRLRDLDLPD